MTNFPTKPTMIYQPLKNVRCFAYNAFHSIFSIKGRENQILVEEQFSVGEGAGGGKNKMKVISPILK